MPRKPQIESFSYFIIFGQWHFFIGDGVLWHKAFVLVKDLASLSRLQRKCFKPGIIVISFPGDHLVLMLIWVPDLFSLQGGPVITEEKGHGRQLWDTAHQEGARLGVPSWLTVPPYVLCQLALSCPVEVTVIWDWEMENFFSWFWPQQSKGWAQQIPTSVRVRWSQQVWTR